MNKKLTHVESSTSASKKQVYITRIRRILMKNQKDELNSRTLTNASKDNYALQGSCACHYWLGHLCKRAHCLGAVFIECQWKESYALIQYEKLTCVMPEVYVRSECVRLRRWKERGMPLQTLNLTWTALKTASKLDGALLDVWENCDATAIESGE